MIVDKLSNLSKYIRPNLYAKIQPFLSGLTKDIPDGQYPIEHDKIFAGVMTYQTHAKENCKIEAHNNYIDIQSTLIGAEGIDIFKRSNLKTIEHYNASDDVEFFAVNKEALYASIVNSPGYFTMIFPEEAHRPMQTVADSFPNTNKPIKKFVIKIEVSYYAQI